MSSCFWQVRDDEDTSITQGVKVLIAITFISWCIYPILWVLGAEGLNVISIDFEVPSSASLNILIIAAPLLLLNISLPRILAQNHLMRSK